MINYLIYEVGLAKKAEGCQITSYIDRNKNAFSLIHLTDEASRAFNDFLT